MISEGVGSGVEICGLGFDGGDSGLRVEGFNFCVLGRGAWA